MPVRKTRLAYLSGPVDAAEVYFRWKAGKHTKLFGTSYLMQFYELCSEIGAEALVITTLPDAFSRRQIDNLVIENRPPPRSRGLRFHLAMLLWMLALAPRLATFRPAAMVITAHQNYWFTLSYAKLFGVEIIPSAHCVMWRPFATNPLHWRFLLWLDGLFFRLFVRRGMAISNTVGDQMKALAKSERFAVETIVPTYGNSHFQGMSPPAPATRPFRVLFNGRAEANKGIFDLLHIASRMNRERPGQFHFDVCGDGSDLDSFRRSVNHSGLDGVISVHGFCDKDELTRLLGNCHAVVVPTRSDFEEGLAKSCVEAVLAGRPFVSSAVCPAVKQLGGAAIEVPPDDADAYGDALLALAEDATLYQRKVEACPPLQSQFYDPQRSYKEALRRQLEHTGVIDGRLPSN